MEPKTSSKPYSSCFIKRLPEINSGNKLRPSLIRVHFNQSLWYFVSINNIKIDGNERLVSFLLDKYRGPNDRWWCSTLGILSAAIPSDVGVLVQYEQAHLETTRWGGGVVRISKTTLHKIVATRI